MQRHVIVKNKLYLAMIILYENKLYLANKLYQEQWPSG